MKQKIGGILLCLVSLLLAPVTQAVELSRDGQLVFPGASLEDLASHTLTARMKGDNFGDDGVEVTFFNRQEFKEGDTLTNITYQLHAIDGDYVNVANVAFTNGVDGVYARLFGDMCVNYVKDLAKFGVEPFTDNPSNNDYRPYDLRICEPAVALSVNFIEDEKGLDTSSSARYGAGRYAVPYSEWNNMMCENRTETLGRMTVTVSGVPNPYHCASLNYAKDVRYSYNDESKEQPTPTVKVSNIPYKNYRVIVYSATSDSNRKFKYVTINGTDYTGVTDGTVHGDSSWGSSGASGKAKGLREGVNYLVSDIISNTSTATVVSHRGSGNSPSRGCIAAVQIVNVPTYTATIDDGGQKTFSALEWDAPLPKFITDELIVVNINENTSLAVDRTVNAEKVTFNVAEGKTLLLSGSSVNANSIFVNGPGMVVVSSESQLAGSLSCDAGKFWTLDTESGVATAVVPDASVRSLDGWVFPDGVDGVKSSSVVLAETREEFGKGSMTVTDIPSGLDVTIVRPDGTSTNVVPTEGTISLSENVKIDGTSTLFDISFKNNKSDLESRENGHFTYKAVDSFSLTYDTVPTFNRTADQEWDDNTGVYIKHHPYVDVSESFVSLGDFAAVVVGTVSPTPSRQFIHLGSSQDEGQGILIATTENANEVIIAANSGSSVDLTRGIKASVPNAATVRHAFVIVRSGNTFNVWVDGVKRGSFTVSDDFVLGKKSNNHSGIQVGSDYGGKIRSKGTYTAVENKDDETGVANVIRVFDYAISDAQAEAVFAAYPYVSYGGLYKRTLSGTEALSQSGAWSKEGEVGVFDLPVGATVDGVYHSPSAELNIEADSSFEVNASLGLENLTIGGSAAVSFTASGNSTMKPQTAVFNTPVTNQYGALDISAAAVQIGQAGSLAFDCSKLDVSGIWTTTRYQLTGLIERDDAKVTLALAPTAADPDKSRIEYNETGSCYDLVVEPSAPGIWVGSVDGNLLDPKNWADGNLPGEGDRVVIGALKTATLYIPEGQKFSPGEIVFPAGSAAVTIEGSGIITNVFAVRNQSGFEQTIDCPLTFNGTYRVYCDKYSVVFAGGATATYPDKDIPNNSSASRTLKGEIYFTEDWINEEKEDQYIVPSGSRLHGKYLTGTVGDSHWLLTVEEGGWAEFDSIRTGYEYGVVRVRGEIHVKKQWVVKSNKNDKWNLVGADNDTGAIYANGIWKDRTASAAWMKPKDFYIGSGGLGATGQDWYMAFDVDGQTIHATEDFEVFSYGNKTNGDWGLNIKASLEFDTDVHTITWTGAVQGDGDLIKSGVGTMVMNPCSSFLTGDVVVEAGTLLLMKSGATGSGPISVLSGAELAVSGENPIMPGGDLTLEDNAILAFNFTNRTLPPVFDVTDKNVTAGEVGEVKVKVGGVRPVGGEYVLTSGGKFTGVNVSLAEGSPEWIQRLWVNADGDIVIDVKSIPFRLIIR